MPAPSHRRAFFRATGRAITAWLLLAASVAAQEEANLGLSQMADKPRHSPAFVSFASSSYKMVELEEDSLLFGTTEFRANSFELMKQHILYSSSNVNTSLSGWRMEAFVDDWRIGFGDEVVATRPFDTAALEPIHSKRLRKFLDGMKTATYGAAGLRLNSFDSGFSFEGLGSILGRTYVDQTIDHTAIGPQLALGAVAESSIWRFEAIAMGMAGYQRVKYEQGAFGGAFGEELIPGAVNRLILGRTTTPINDRDEDKFAWQAETRLTASCQLTHHWRFDATWRGFVTGPVYGASEAVVYSVPTFGLQEPRADKAYGSDLFLGLTYLR